MLGFVCVVRVCSVSAYSAVNIYNFTLAATNNLEKKIKKSLNSY